MGAVFDKRKIINEIINSQDITKYSSTQSNVILADAINKLFPKLNTFYLILLVGGQNLQINIIDSSGTSSTMTIPNSTIYNIQSGLNAAELLLTVENGLCSCVNVKNDSVIFSNCKSFTKFTNSMYALLIGI